MERLPELVRRVRSGLRSTSDVEMDEEMRFHLERQTEKNLRLGMTAEEARRNALVKFGGVDRAKEYARDEARPVLLEDATRDLRYGIRSLLRAPGFALVSILTLGLGIGAATAVFSVVQGVLLRPLAFPQHERIVRMFQIDQDGHRLNGASEANFEDWMRQTRSFSAMAEMGLYGKVSVAGPAGFEPNRAELTAVSREFLDVMRVQPKVGRGFNPEEQRVGGAPAVLVGAAYWKRFLGGRTNLNELTLRVGAEVFQVVGVMPEGFAYPGSTEIWFPRELRPPETQRTAHNFLIIGRVRDDVMVSQAQTELSSVSKAMKVQYGDQTTMVDAAALPLLEVMTSNSKQALLVLLAAALFLLVIACANVSNLLLTRAATRTREIALRLALGAGQWRVTRQLLAESLVLCLIGGALGVLSAYVGIKVLLAAEPGSLPRLEEIGISWPVLLFALGISLLAALVLGLLTMLRSRSRDLRGALSAGQRTVAGSRNSQRVRDGLVVGQVAMTLVLLSAAGLLGRSFLRLLAIDSGFRTDSGLIIDLALPFPETPAAAQHQVRVQDALMERLRAVPGVTGVGLTNAFPLAGAHYSDGQFIEMNSPDEINSFEQFQRMAPADIQARSGQAGFRVVSGDYFKTMRIPLIRGRLFEPSDGADAPHVAVVSELLAKTRWPGQDPIGKFIQFGNMDGDLRGFRIVGVVGDVRDYSPENVPQALFYADYRQRPLKSYTFSLVLHGPRADAVRSDAQRIIREIDPDLPVQTRTVVEAVDLAVAGRRFSLVLIMVFGATALVLAALGIYGVISYLVAQRTREIGIRMALGARSNDVMRMIVGKGFRLSLLGSAIGLVAALALTRFLSGLLFGISATDPLAYLVVLVLTTGAVLIASYVPARRALRVAPVVTLRSE